MKPASMSPWLTIVLFLVLALGLPVGPGAAAADLSPQAEAALFSLTGMEPPDLATKSVTVEVYASPAAELTTCRCLLPLAWSRVEQFYARLGVHLRYRPGAASPGPLAPAQCLRVELLPDKEWLEKSFMAFEVPPPFRLRFLQICRNKCAFAHLPLSTVHISFKRFEEAELRPEAGTADRNHDWLGNLMIHELGHLLGLYHAYEFTNDGITEYLPDKTPNFMSQQIAGQSRLGFVDWQKRLIHSYLGHGKVFQQYQQVNFDPLDYLKLVKRYNGYREPLAHTAKVAHKLKTGKARTFDDDDEDDDDDDYRAR